MELDSNDFSTEFYLQSDEEAGIYPDPLRQRKTREPVDDDDPLTILLREEENSNLIKALRLDSPVPSWICSPKSEIIGDFDPRVVGALELDEGVLFRFFQDSDLSCVQLSLEQEIILEEKGNGRDYEDFDVFPNKEGVTKKQPKPLKMILKRIN